jgi:hypothetical protein
VLGVNVQPIVSSNIEKGSPWFDELREALDNADCGILCLNQDAVGSPWVHFEAGLLVRALSTSSKPGMAKTTERRVFPLLWGITSEALKGPLAAYQSTSASDIDDVLRLMKAIYKLIPTKEKPVFSEVGKRVRSGWESFQTLLSDIPHIELEKIIPDFNHLFQRKTFLESIYRCLNRDWLSRYNGALKIFNRIKGHEEQVRACRLFIKDAYAALVASLDSYVMCLSQLLGTSESSIHAESGQIHFDKNGIATACEQHRKRILELVENLSDKNQMPIFDESFRFGQAAFMERKNLIHEKKAFADKELAHTDTQRRNKFARKLELCADSLWDFDRILYFHCHEEETDLELKKEVRRARRELEKANAKGVGASLMGLNYSLGPVEKALTAPPAEPESASVKLLCEDVRKYIERTNTDEGGQVRAALDRIEASLLRKV